MFQIELPGALRHSSSWFCCSFTQLSICEEKVELTESSLNLACFASHKQIYAMVLVGQNVKERILEILELIVAFSGYRYGLAFARRGIFFDEVLDIVVINVICNCVSRLQRAIPRNQAEQSHWTFQCQKVRRNETRSNTYDGSKQELSAASTSLRTSLCSRCLPISASEARIVQVGEVGTGLCYRRDMALRHGLVSEEAVGLYIRLEIKRMGGERSCIFLVNATQLASS